MNADTVAYRDFSDKELLVQIKSKPHPGEINHMKTEMYVATKEAIKRGILNQDYCTWCILPQRSYRKIVVIPIVIPFSYSEKS